MFICSMWLGMSLVAGQRDSWEKDINCPVHCDVRNVRSTYVQLALTCRAICTVVFISFLRCWLECNSAEWGMVDTVTKLQHFKLINAMQKDGSRLCWQFFSIKIKCFTRVLFSVYRFQQFTIKLALNKINYAQSVRFPAVQFLIISEATFKMPYDLNTTGCSFNPIKIQDMSCCSKSMYPLVGSLIGARWTSQYGGGGKWFGNRQTRIETGDFVHIL